jgi:hypothetical protein
MIGSIVFATDQGLGYLAKDFFDNNIVQQVYIQPHSSRKSHYDWYPKSSTVDHPEDLLKQNKALIFFEEAFYWKLMPLAREAGIKTILMPMYECTREPLPYPPDLILAPSLLDLEYYRDYKNLAHLPVPVSVRWKKRTRARVFIHNAGNLGLGGRNGTREVLEALQYVKSPVRLVVRSQVDFKAPSDPRLTVKIGQFPKDEIFDEGDVFLFPEKFNGLSLPLQEAFASGMLVMAGDRFPMNRWLPKEPLIPVHHYTTERISRNFRYAHYDPRDIARTIDEWYNKDIQKYSLMGQKWAVENSWKKLKPKYRSLINGLCDTAHT